MKKWKYVRNQLCVDHLEEFDEYLKTVGELGWELVYCSDLTAKFEGNYVIDVVLKQELL